MSCLTPILNSSYSETFGFFITDDSCDCADNISSSEAKVNNLVNFLGYIPLVGLIVGIYRIRFAADHSHVGYKNTQRMRAVFEITGLGLLMLIPDLIMTLYRNFECCQPQQTRHFSMNE